MTVAHMKRHVSYNRWYFDALFAHAKWVTRTSYDFLSILAKFIIIQFAMAPVFHLLHPAGWLMITQTSIDVRHE